MTYNNNSINIYRGRQVAVGAESLSHITIITDVSKFSEKAREKGKAEHARHAPESPTWLSAAHREREKGGVHRRRNPC